VDVIVLSRREHMGHQMIRRCLGGNPVFTTMVLAGQNASADISGFVLSEQAAMKGCYWLSGLDSSVKNQDERNHVHVCDSKTGARRPTRCMTSPLLSRRGSRRPRKSECAKQKKNPPKVNVSQLTRTARWEWQIGQIQVDSLPILANEKRKLVITPDFRN